MAKSKTEFVIQIWQDNLHMWYDVSCSGDLVRHKDMWDYLIQKYADEPDKRFRRIVRPIPSSDQIMVFA